MDMTFARTCTRKLAEHPFVLSSVPVAAAPNRREPLVTLQQRTQSKQKQWLPSFCIRCCDMRPCLYTAWAELC